eukprot:TRINITY_DN51391_c0_g1_i1.p1 TRINITY_DN51391_c0_g1~~TRINITY_DN51391_c0_g1_i1.p1  ORF type:complete len:481 (+),score=152.88 TRINITY_DN51391_c0_g1_i1:68-1510(+)
MEDVSPPAVPPPGPRKRRRLYDLPDLVHLCGVDRDASPGVTTRLIPVDLPLKRRRGGAVLASASVAALTPLPGDDDTAGLDVAQESVPPTLSTPGSPDFLQHPPMQGPPVLDPLPPPAATTAPLRNGRAIHLLNNLRDSFDPQRFEFTRNLADIVPAVEVEELCSLVVSVLTKEPALIDVASDCWVIGDVHGNFGDLLHFVQELVPFDITLCPYQLVCLGDYVDRGPHSLQCVLLLFCLKVMSPGTVNLLRGNHEDPSVCGDVDNYGDGSFRRQCQMAYGMCEGEALYQKVCQAFAHLPLAALIDKKIFCAHGGIPRFYPKRSDCVDSKGHDYRLDVLRDPTFPRFSSLFTQETYERLGAEPDLKLKREREWIVAYDLLWSDPVVDSRAADVDEDGFASSERGGQAVAFSSKAVEAFLKSFDLDLMIRAHQEKRLGLRVSQSSRVITVFSSSNYQNHGNGAGVVLVRKSGKVDLIMKTSG